MSTGPRRLYGFWLSPYMALVAHVLEESDLDYEYVRVSPFLGENQSDAHKARNPLGKVPVLEEPGGPFIAESQAICRYLARTYPAVSSVYPCDDAARCLEVDALNDFVTFSISGPFFNWFVIGGYAPQAWRLDAATESKIFSDWSMIMILNAVGRLKESARFAPFLLGAEPALPDFHLFHILEIGKTFSRTFDMPGLDLATLDPTLGEFHGAMCERPSTRRILDRQAAEFPESKRAIFEAFEGSVAGTLEMLRPALSGLFGHPV